MLRRRLAPSHFLVLAQITLGVVALNIVTGAAVRLSDSGLGCPDWPNCNQRHLTAPLAGHAGIEFGNRLVVVAVTLLAAATFLAAFRRGPFRRDLAWLSGGLVGGIIGEALLGAVVVYSKLNPYVVMAHFTLGIVLLLDALVLALRAGRSDEPGRLRVGRRDLTVARTMFALLAVVIVAGTATTGAGPHAGGKGAKRIPVPLDDVARIHSGLVWLLGALTLYLLWRLYRAGAPEAVQERGRLLLGAMVAQGLIGYTQFFTHLPPVLVGFHVFGAELVFSAMVWFVDGLYRHSAEAVSEPQPVPTPTVAA